MLELEKYNIDRSRDYRERWVSENEETEEKLRENLPLPPLSSPSRLFLPH